MKTRSEIIVINYIIRINVSKKDNNGEEEWEGIFTDKIFLKMLKNSGFEIMCKISFIF